VVRIDLNRPMSEVRAELSKYPVKTRLSLTGTLVVARDIAHAKIKERLDAGEEMPQYLKDHPVYYAGPAKTPEGYASGSFGPTTAVLSLSSTSSAFPLYRSTSGRLVHPVAHAETRLQQRPVAARVRPRATWTRTSLLALERIQ